MLQLRGKPIVVILDDVDRLSKDEIRELFKLVRLTASFPNLIYIVACDRVRVEEALDDSRSGLRSDYLEKIFQWSFHIPAAGRERIRRELHTGLESALCGIDLPFGEKDWPDIEAEIVRPLVRNMRDVRRYCMAVRGVGDSLEQSIALVDILALEAIRLFMPRLFGQFPNLIDLLTIPPAWESSEERIADIVSEQIDDTDKLAELRQSRLEEALQAVDAESRPVARAAVHRLFAGGRVHRDNYHPDWSRRQLSNNRVAHRIIFRLYLTRVEDGDLACSNCARRAFECLHDPHATGELMRSQDADTWPKTVLLLWSMFESEFERKHAEPAMVVFWNLLPDMPGPSPFALDEPASILRTVSISLLETLIGTDGATHTISNTFQQLQTLTSKAAFVIMVRAFARENRSLISAADLHDLEGHLNNQILSANADDLLGERHPAQILLFSSPKADPPRIPHMIHDSPKLTFALMFDCLTKSSTGEFGGRATTTTRGISWANMITIHGGEATLKARLEDLDQKFSTIESWITSELGVSSEDALDLLEEARSFVSGELSEF